MNSDWILNPGFIFADMARNDFRHVEMAASVVSRIITLCSQSLPADMLLTSCCLLLCFIFVLTDYQNFPSPMAVSSNMHDHSREKKQKNKFRSFEPYTSISFWPSFAYQLKMSVIIFPLLFVESRSRASAWLVGGSLMENTILFGFVDIREGKFWYSYGYNIEMLEILILT